jgi:hypothetical protein
VCQSIQINTSLTDSSLPLHALGSQPPGLQRYENGTEQGDLQTNGVPKNGKDAAGKWNGFKKPAYRDKKKTAVVSSKPGAAAAAAAAVAASGGAASGDAASGGRFRILHLTKLPQPQAPLCSNETN